MMNRIVVQINIVTPLQVDYGACFSVVLELLKQTMKCFFILQMEEFSFLKA